jgi:hypothetical protein
MDWCGCSEIDRRLSRHVFPLVIMGVYGGKGSMLGEIRIGVVIHGMMRIHCLCFTYTPVFTVSLEKSEVVFFLTLSSCPRPTAAPTLIL